MHRVECIRLHWAKVGTQGNIKQHAVQIQIHADCLLLQLKGTLRHPRQRRALASEVVRDTPEVFVGAQVEFAMVCASDGHQSVARISIGQLGLHTADIIAINALKYPRSALRIQTPFQRRLVGQIIRNTRAEQPGARCKLQRHATLKILQAKHTKRMLEHAGHRPLNLLLALRAQYGVRYPERFTLQGESTELLECEVKYLEFPRIVQCNDVSRRQLVVIDDNAESIRNGKSTQCRLHHV